MQHRKNQSKHIALDITKFDNAPLHVRHHVPLSLKLAPAPRRELLLYELLEVVEALHIFFKDSHAGAAITRAKKRSNLEYSLTLLCEPLRGTDSDDDAEQGHTYRMVFAFGSSVRNQFLSRREALQVAIHDVEQQIEKLSTKLKHSPIKRIYGTA